MAMARTCDACKALIPQKQYVQLAVRVLKSNDSDTQDALEEYEGDYCDGCLASGAALEDLVGAFQKYNGLEPSKLKERG